MPDMPLPKSPTPATGIYCNKVKPAFRLHSIYLPRSVTDSDDPISAGEVGKVGVSISSIQDMELLFQDIPLDKVSTSMTINAPATILLAMYIAVARRRGIEELKLRGTIQNDILKEYVARGTYIYPPAAIHAFDNRYFQILL